MGWQVIIPPAGALMPILAWLKENKDVIASVTNIVTSVALILGFISIWAGLVQLGVTSANIKSNTVYQISHEGREIAKGIVPNMPIEKVGPVVSYMYSVWKQHQLGTYDDELWAPFSEEVCEFLKTQKNSFDSYWGSSKRFFAPAFIGFMDARRVQCG
jgi:hypothetical protein